MNYFMLALAGWVQYLILGQEAKVSVLLYIWELGIIYTSELKKYLQTEQVCA